MLVSLLAICILSLVALVLYAYDKLCAQNGMWRISEFTLLFVAACGGAMGALSAMYLFHHKTQKPQFVYGVPLMILVQTILLIIFSNIFLCQFSH